MLIKFQDGYKCLCEWGYKSVGDFENPICEDFDECMENPCYPSSSCLNLPGSFKCGSCPKGTLGIYITTCTKLLC